MQLPTPRLLSVPIRRRLAGLVAVVLTATGALAATPAGASPADETADPGTAQYLVTGPQTFDDVDAVAATGAAVDEVDRGKVFVTATPAEVQAIRALGFAPERVPSVTPAPGYPENYPPGYGNYHTYAELNSVVDDLVAAHPTIAQRHSYGTSHEGRDLIAMKISSPVGQDLGKPEVLLSAGMHAREHLTVEMAIYLMRMFTEEYGVDPQITDLVDNRVIWIMPQVNPDGGEWDIATGSFRSWRKNRQPNPGTSAVGTDLNRNFGHQWGGSGSSGSPSSATYRGSAPFSAPEAEAYRQFVLSRIVDGEQRITMNIDFHTYSELVLWPYGYTSASLAPGLNADARDTFQAIGAEMAGSNGYQPMQASQLYVASGVSIDWMWANQGIFAYTFEMFPASASGGGFYPPDSVIPAETARNRDAVLLLTEYADCPWRAINKEDEYCDSGNGGGGQVLFADDFTTSTGWTRDPAGTDTATAGQWERAAPQATSWNGLPLQLGTPVAGGQMLVTGAAAGNSPGDHDVDDGVTTTRSPVISLPAQGAATLTFSWYLAHLNNSGPDDYFRVSVQHNGGTTVVLNQAGAATNRPAAWSQATVDLSAYAGQNIRILVQAADEGAPSLVEAGFDNIQVTVS
ncbi:choice-of-anchor J domain-containing protein [Natronosporangium hydrolyticum]|uniref:Zinc carboxypeptidase n=1 Tax=Natronosporangium hydrolyticum TaxID=2811111 RepID=A0A895YGB3_9ACTN|nr:M14 family zinc carboxypeptidase [Natronosporangium hydrolyticum]QSB15115.1 choice-of-anchor J domain-containing protein [Natronosporangium hydrolyticum]